MTADLEARRGCQWRGAAPTSLLTLRSLSSLCGGGGAGAGCRLDQIERYRGRLSGPLLDRIDLQVQLEPVEPARLLGPADGEPSSVVAARVATARAIAAERWGPGATVRDALPGRLRASCSRAGLDALGRAVDALGLSARAFDRCLRVARTVADLEGVTLVAASHVDEAVAYRLPPTRAWLPA